MVVGCKAATMNAAPEKRLATDRPLELLSACSIPRPVAAIRR